MEAPDDTPPQEPLVFMADTGNGNWDFGPLSLVACDDVLLTHSSEKHLDPFYCANRIIRVY